MVKYTFFQSGKKKKENMGNRRRPGTFVLTGQRDIIPIAMGAACAAVAVHAALFFYAPSISFLNPQHRSTDVEVKDEISIAFVPPKKESEEPPPLEEPMTTETQEIDEVIRKPEEKEIDILDFKPQELEMSPGETDLALPSPVSAEDDPGEMTEMPVSELDASTLAEVSVPQEALQVAEPTPVNASDVIVVSETQTQDVEAANSLVNSDLREQAKSGDGKLPDDTRSLADLMNVSNPGANSGVARLGADLLFKFDECRLTSAARFSMLQLAALIQKNPETDFVIEGHTDSFGGADYNALLSLQRAAAVCEWLQKNRVPVNRVHIRACGNKAPLASVKGDREQQSLNRRVEIHMRRKGEELPEGCFPATYAVDLDTPTRDQIKGGVRVPEVYTPSSTTAEGDAKKAAADKKETAKPAADKAKPKPADKKPADKKPADKKPADKKPAAKDKKSDAKPRKK